MAPSGKALAHLRAGAFFETVRPFVDGSGRTVVRLCLVSRLAPGVPVPLRSSGVATFARIRPLDI